MQLYQGDAHFVFFFFKVGMWKLEEGNGDERNEDEGNGDEEAGMRETGDGEAGMRETGMRRQG